MKPKESQPQVTEESILLGQILGFKLRNQNREFQKNIKMKLGWV